MEIEKLCKEDFRDASRGEPKVRFSSNGVVYFNKAAVKHLGLYDKKTGCYSSVQICRDLKVKSDFGVFKDPEGWQLRKDHEGIAVFNCMGLAQHVIDATWERTCHAVGVEKPRSMTFLVARLPLDDEKNKDVFALIRKKG